MTTKKIQVLINQKPYNLTVYTERRNSVRASITNSGIIIRIPKHLSKKERQAQARKFAKWAIQKIQDAPEMATQKTYTHSDFIRTHSKTYQLQIYKEPREKNFSKLKGSHIIFKIPEHHKEEKSQAYIRRQLRKLLAKQHLPELEYHVNRLNTLHLNKQVGKVSYKYTISRWGACTHLSKEINLSTRLLLAPQEILEYVIVHELAHLIEPNHSKRFWNIVKSIDPNYKQKKKWLNDNGNTLNI